MILSGYSGLLNAFFIGGRLLIVIGSIILPMRHFTNFKWSHYLNPSSWHALIAAVGTAGYSIVDSWPIHGLRIPIKNPQQIIAVTLIYALLQVIFASLWMGMVLLYNEQTRQSVVLSWSRKFKASLLTGMGIHATYVIVLISMSMVKNVSYIVAFRQGSIPIGVTFGIHFLKSHSQYRRF